MSIFGKIVSAIFGNRSASAGAATGTASPSTVPSAGAGGGKPMSRAEVEAMIQKIADDTGRSNYNWKQSIVDLMKLLDLDSSLSARKELAQELGYTGALDGSAEMNIWLHKQVMERLMASGGKVPAELT
jgi:hypothetical protein